MRTLDVDFEKVLRQLSNEQLDGLIERVDKEFLWKDTTRDVYINTEKLKEIVKDVCGQEIGKMLSDEDAIKAVTDKDEKGKIEASAMVYEALGEDPSFRMISEGEIKALISRAKIMNKGAKFAQNFAGMSSKQIEDLSLYDEKYSFRQNEGRKYEIDPEYGINLYEKHDIFEILIAQAKAKEFVNQIPPKDVAESKKKFESVKNRPIVAYMFADQENRGILKNVFGVGELDFHMLPVDIENALEDRSKEIENKSISNKIKNMFNRVFSAPKLARAFIKDKMVALQKMTARKRMEKLLPTKEKDKEGEKEEK